MGSLKNKLSPKMIRFIFFALIAIAILVTQPFLAIVLFSLATFVRHHFVIVGAGNRFLWALLLPLQLAALGICAYFLMQMVSMHSPLLQALLGLVLIATLPALSFYLAHRFQQFRATRSFLPRE